jgi:hypothetical protein
MRVEALAQILLDEAFSRVAPAKDNILFQARRDDIGDGSLTRGDGYWGVGCTWLPGRPLVPADSLSFGRPSVAHGVSGIGIRPCEAGSIDE